MSEESNGELQNEEGIIHDVLPVSGMYENWFLDYASYVILERAVPAINDGLKPVQRRIMHAMREMDDGRYNKVANIIGSTMQYHPHGDMSIGDAMVNLGQKVMCGQEIERRHPGILRLVLQSLRWRFFTILKPLNGSFRMMDEKRNLLLCL
jgi:hypothetical protein